MAAGRIEFLDVAKGLGIISIVAYHGGLGLAIGNYFQLYDYYLLCLSMFFFISGFLFHEQQTIRQWLQRRGRELYLPFVGFGLLFLLLHNVFYTFHLVDDWYTPGQFLFAGARMLAFDLTEVFLAAFWFLSALFFIECFFLLVFKSLQHVGLEHGTGWYIVVCILCYALSQMLAARGIKPMYSNCALPDVVLANMMFFTAGWGLRRLFYRYGNAWGERLFRRNWLMLLCLGVLVFMQNKLHFVFDPRVCLYTHPVWFPLFAFMGLYVILYLAELIHCHFPVLKKGLAYSGQATVFILALHFVSFKLIGLFQVHVLGNDISRLPGWQNVNVTGHWPVLYFATGLAVPLLVRFLYHRLQKTVWENENEK